MEREKERANTLRRRPLRRRHESKNVWRMKIWDKLRELDLKEQEMRTNLLYSRKWKKLVGWKMMSTKRGDEAEGWSDSGKELSSAAGKVQITGRCDVCLPILCQTPLKSMTRIWKVKSTKECTCVCMHSHTPTYTHGKRNKNRLVMSTDSGIWKEDLSVLTRTEERRLKPVSMEKYNQCYADKCLTAALWKRKALICSTCQSPWCQVPYNDQIQAINILLLNVELGRDLYNSLNDLAPACHWI